MDAEYTAKLGEPLNSRQPRLTNPDLFASGNSQNGALTGIDTGSHGTIGRNGIDQAEQQVQWSSPITRHTADPEPAPRALSEPESPSRRSMSEAETAPRHPEPAPWRSPLDSEPRPAFPESESPGRRSLPDSAPHPVFQEAELSGRRSLPEPEPHPAFPETEVSGRRSLPDAEPSPRRAASDNEPAPRLIAPEPGPSGRRAVPEPQPASRRAAPEPEPAQAVSRGDSPTIDLHQIMRLLVTSHDLDAAALKAEAGEITVSELARAARRTRSAAVDLIAAWYGGPAEMRKFGEVLLQAAAETA
ncbi:hypothetical protein [Nocardia sp. NPDC127526]|uniref:hypothetical protein n=1 Tax=Nocardia sp. NPDC127526 TaxID=3345393 RepID=UPI00363273DD